MNQRDPRPMLSFFLGAMALTCALFASSAVEPSAPAALDPADHVAIYLSLGAE